MDRREPRQQRNCQPRDHEQRRGRDTKPASEGRDYRAQHDEEQDGLYTAHAAVVACLRRGRALDQSSCGSVGSMGLIRTGLPTEPALLLRLQVRPVTEEFRGLGSEQPYRGKGTLGMSVRHDGSHLLVGGSVSE
jgi:hypothetical protein